MKRIKQFRELKRFFEGHNGAIKTPFQAYSPFMTINRKYDAPIYYYWEIRDFRENKNLHDDVDSQLSLKIHII